MEETRKQTLETLRKFFTLTTGMMDLMASVNMAKEFTENRMFILHKLMLVELNKENPNPSLIDTLLSEMEEQAEINAKTNNNGKQ